MLAWLKKRTQARVASTKGSILADAADADPRAALRRQANAFVDAGDLVAAEHCYRQLSASDGADTSALVGLGFALSSQGRSQEAVDVLTRAAAANPLDHDTHYMLGGLHDEAGAVALAVHHLQQAVALHPSFSLASRDLARVLFQSGRSDEAREALRAGLAREPGFADLHFYLGHVELEGGDAVAAQSAYEGAVASDPGHAGAWMQLGALRRRAGEFAAAATCYRKVLDAHAMHGDAAIALGQVLLQDSQPAAAVQAFERAVAAEPSNAAAHNQLANALVMSQRGTEALVHYERAMLLRPDIADAFVNLGHTFNSLKRGPEAVAAYARARAFHPDADFLFGSWLVTRLQLCDWAGLEEAFDELARRVDRGERAATPFTVLGTSLSARQQLRCAESYVKSMNYPPEQSWPPAPMPMPMPMPAHRRIRLGYFSADFHGHATAYLMAELFERHDKNRFELIALSFGPVSAHPMRRRLEAAFDRFIDVAALSDAEITAQARALEIDIAVDLKGFTEDARTGIFARRAAPVQVSYLGYPGTMGAPFIDYLIADSTLIPLSDLDAYAEKIVFMPHSYQVNDRHREIAAHCPSRADCGLPEDGFVFASFNNTYKITPDVFDVWMRLLHQLPGSVLWLLADTPQAMDHLRAEALRRDVPPARLVFAARVPMPEHLARQALADLFLDTGYYNAHTTASDALWAGLPVLTCLGRTFAGRVAGSLLRAAGLPELVTGSLADYADKALMLARDPVQLRALRQRLAANRSTCPLFDAALFARHLESAYLSMWQRHLDGLPPDHLHVAA